MSNKITNIKGAIFDLDGTILDSMYIWSEIGLLFLKNKGITPEPGVEDEFITMSLKEAAIYYIEHFDSSATIEGIVADINALVQDFYFNQVLKKPGVEEFLEFLSQKNVKMCIATATDRYLVEKALERNGLLKYFSDIFTCNGVGAGKNKSVIYDVSLDYLGTSKEDTYVFEDALYAIKTANAAGYKIIGINDVSEKADPDIVKGYCSYYINGYDEIFDLFDM